MRESDPPKSPGSPAPDRLLDELQSIKDLLGSDMDLFADDPGVESNSDAAPTGDIPLLDDLVVKLPPQPPLLDIDNIFNDDSMPALASGDEEQTSIPFVFPKFTLDVMISDDAVDEDDHRAAGNTAPAPAAPQTTAATAAPAIGNAIVNQPTNPPNSSLGNTTRNTSLGTLRNTLRNYNRELLIQELVDEFIPQIEAALHERLNGLDDDALQALKNAE